MLPVFCHRTTLAHWTSSGPHLDIFLWSPSRLLSQLYLQFYSLHLILATQTFFIVFIMKMVVVTIIADSIDHTIGKSKYIRLLSCSLYNSWYNLRRRGEISISDRKDNSSIQLIPPAILCKYSLESLTEALEEIVSEEKGFTVSMNQWQFLIPKKRDLNSIEMMLYPSRLISVCKRKNSISRFTSFNSYLVHCDLLDKDENLCNGESLSILALTFPGASLKG